MALAEVADKADTKADTKKDSLPKMPDSPDVADLCRYLQDAAPLKHGQALKIAVDFAHGKRDKAKNLLRQARRYPHLWRSPK